MNNQKKKKRSRSNSGSKTETEEEKERRMALSRKCKEKVQEIREDKNTDENKEEMKEEKLVSPKTFRHVAFDVRKEIRDQLEDEGKLDSVGTEELKTRIRNLMKKVLGVPKISDDSIQDVLFLTDSESEKKSESEKEKKDSSSDSERSIHNVDVKDGGSDDKVHHSYTKDSERNGEEFDENEDIMLFMDDDDVKNIEDMQGSERLQVFDKVNGLTKFPGYQPKPKESLLQIVIKSVGLMRLLKQNKKLVDSEVEEAEDLIKAIRTERVRQRWIRESTGKANLEKVVECSGEKRDVHSQESPHPVQSPGSPKVTVDNTTATQVTLPDFLDESPPKIKLSPILEMLADDNAEKEDIVKCEGNESQNIDVQEEKDVTKENACTENENKREENKTEVHSDRDENQSPLKEDNDSEGSNATGIRDVLIGGADVDVIDGHEEEDR